MTDLPFPYLDLDSLQERHPRFDRRAYVFVYEAVVDYCRSFDPPRHLTPHEVAEAVRRRALDRFGIMARTVLRHWGIHASDDIGRVVHAMVQEGILVTQSEDEHEDYSNALDFEEAFELDYPWTGLR
jgi:uncharacterized repeat protein (TIGR04138 family)